MSLPGEISSYFDTTSPNQECSTKWSNFYCCSSSSWSCPTLSTLDVLSNFDENIFSYLEAYPLCLKITEKVSYLLTSKARRQLSTLLSTLYSTLLFDKVLLHSLKIRFFNLKLSTVAYVCQLFVYIVQLFVYINNKLFVSRSSLLILSVCLCQLAVCFGLSAVC